MLLQGDALGYHQIANTLLAANQFSTAVGGAPNAIRTPAYPAFVASVYGAFGAKPWVVLLLQALIDTLTCALVIRLAGRWLGFNAGLFAGVLYAIDPFMVLYANLLLSEVLCVFLVALGATFLLTWRDRPWAAGLAFGLATLTRPVVQFVPLVAFAWILLARPRLPAGRAVQACALFALAFALVVAPWLIRNRATFGAAKLSTSGAFNLLVLDVAPAVAEARGEDPSATATALLAEADRRAASDNEFTRAREWEKTAIEYARRYPVACAKHYALGVAHAFLNLGTSAFAQALGLESRRVDMKAYGDLSKLGRAFVTEKPAAQKALGAVVGLELLLVYALSLWGLVALLRARAVGAEGALCLGLVLYFILLTGSAGDARFRLPALPFYLPFAGYAAVLTRRNR